MPLLTFRFWPIPGFFFHPFLIMWLGYVIYTTYLLYTRQKNEVGLKKMQTKYILLGMIIGFVGGSTNYLLWYKIPIAPFGNILVSIYVAMTAYAIIKHRLFDIRLIVARAVAYTALVLILGIIYASGLFIIGAVFIGATAVGNQLLASTILALAMAFTFQPLRRYLEKSTDRIFYKDRYNAQKLLYNLTVIMASTLRLEDLTHQLLREVISQMRITRGAFILTKGDHIYEIAHEGYHSTPELEEGKVITLLNQNKMLIFEELSEGEIKDIMRELNFTIAIYLRTEGEQIGLLTFGEKLSGDIYTSDDIRVLEIFAPEAAVAIQNAQAYEEIRRFSITLQEEVDRATKELRDANDKLRVLDKLKDEFLSLAAHELRTPMTAIKSYLWMVINRSTTLDDAKKKTYMDRIYYSTERLLNLVNELLDISRIESGRLKLTPVEFDLLALAHEVGDEFTAKVSERKQVLTIQDESIPQIYADKDKAHEVLLNLIGNASKYTPEGGKISVSFLQKDGMVETNVSDTGRGIAKEDMGKLFQKFGRLDNTLVGISETGGSGLGLYLCKQLIELSGGKIWVESEVGKGSTFTFSLPITKEKAVF